MLLHSSTIREKVAAVILKYLPSNVRHVQCSSLLTASSV